MFDHGRSALLDECHWAERDEDGELGYIEAWPTTSENLSVFFSDPLRIR
jgi:hypothetical protein